jgi:hypothetical protein
MKTFKQFILEQVVYNKPDHEKMSHEEHDETVVQSAAIKSGDMDSPHPAITKAIHHFATNKPAFTKALQTSKIQKVAKGTEINNSEIGQGLSNVDKIKKSRVKKQLSTGIDRPIILRHKDKNGNTHHHLLAGNTRATTVGYGVQAHHIDV